jgi:Tfp pilus assembly protein PilF
VTSHPPFPTVRRPHPGFIVLLLAVFTVFAYWRVGQAGFVNLDDDAYVEHQPLVNQGIRPAAIVWALTGTHSNNWHPLTTLSHILDCEVFGVRAAPMHWENLVWHILNSALVFLVWRALTGATWRPAVLAALFALHPLHVESVAWISERKDVLSAFFWLLGLGAYVRYARIPSTGRYLLVTGAMILALLSKPMAVTFPCTLLLLDFWPLRRWPGRAWKSLFIEKLPLFAVAALHSVLTFVVQSSTGAGQYGERFPFGARLGNAIISYARYLGKTFWPDGLSPMYFHPGYWPTVLVAGATLGLAAVTIVIWWHRRTRPWLIFGWLWFLGTLVPVIGLVQVGAQSMADRYMYVPILGVFTLVVWQFARLVHLWPRTRGVLIAATASILLTFGIVTGRQVKTWNNSIALYQHSIDEGEDNAAVRYLLAIALQAAGRPQAEVVAQFQHALERQPDYVNALTQLAIVALSSQRMDEARTLIEQTVRLEPANPGLHANLGAYWRRAGRPDEAIRHFEHVLQLDPKSSGAHLELGQIRLEKNEAEAGRAHYEIRARLDRWNPEAQADYGTLLCNLRRLDEARRYLERALWLRPDFPRARQNLDATNQLLKQQKG